MGFGSSRSTAILHSHSGYYVLVVIVCGVNMHARIMN